MSRRLELFCDGASRGNPGPGALGYVILENGVALHEEGKTLGIVTNNVAEYEALLAGLRKCQELGAQSLVIHSDSEVLVRQLKGEYKVRTPHLAPLHAQALSLLQAFPKSVVNHIPREANKRADALANQALDEG